jgi:hypothetical protein
MAFTNRNDFLTGRKPVPTPAGGEVVATRFPIALVAADLDSNDTGAVGLLPPGCVPVALIYDSDDLDTAGSPLITASVGFINADESDLSGAAWATGIQTSRTGGSLQVDLTAAAMRIAPSDSERKFGIRFTAGAGTKAAGEVGLTLLYRAA